MALTKTFGDALSLCYTTLKRELETSFATEACNLATSFIWNRGDWRESLVELPPFYLIPNEQEHGLPTYSVPSDYLGLREAFCTNLQGTTPIQTPLKVQHNVDRTNAMGIPTLISYIPSQRAFRVWPRVPSGICVPYWIVEGNYKTVAPVVTADTLNDETLPWDDQYFMNYLEVLTWAGMKLSGDPRAGQVQVVKGTPTVTGQLAAATNAVQVMLEQEGLNLGHDQIMPAESMVGGGNGNVWW